MIKKLLYLFRQRYNPYPFYWFDLLTERHLKNRIGECVDCIKCCKHVEEGQCKFIDLEMKRCKIYNNRTCNEWFPVSQKEIDYRTKIQPGFECKFSFKNNI
jgi:hypothetical protein